MLKTYELENVSVPRGNAAVLKCSSTATAGVLLWARAGYKPVSVPPAGAAVIPLGQTLLPGSSNLPGSRAERAAPPPLFGLAPHGVCPAIRITPDAVRSYRTFSPLPPCGGGIFSVALSVKSALSESPRPLAGMLPCGDRTFLQPAPGALKPASDCPPARTSLYCRARFRRHVQAQDSAPCIA